jgi:S1-C subfamily serine protease
MAEAERQRLLLERAQRALGTNKVEQAVAKVRAIVGPSDIPASEEKAQAAFDKLRNGEAPDAVELAALEIVIRLLRPVIYTRGGGALDGLPDDEGRNLYTQELKDLWSGFRAKAKDASKSVGRIERNGEHIGTGFLVAGGFLATNRHVLAVLTYGTEVIAPGVARVCFKSEMDEINKPESYVAIESAKAIHPRLDMVLLSLARQDRPSLEMAAESLPQGSRIVVIGYPGEDRENNPLFLTSVFGRGFGVRRVALGEVLDGTANPNMFHDASTTRGNSGSPVFALETGQVAGIHRGGFFMYRNEAVDLAELAAFVGAPVS